MTYETKQLTRKKVICDYCFGETTAKSIMCCDGSMANCCMNCRKELRHEHDEEGECLI